VETILWLGYPAAYWLALGLFHRESKCGMHQVLTLILRCLPKKHLVLSRCPVLCPTHILNGCGQSLATLRANTSKGSFGRTPKFEFSYTVPPASAPLSKCPSVPGLPIPSLLLFCFILSWLIKTPPHPKERTQGPTPPNFAPHTQLPQASGSKCLEARVILHPGLAGRRWLSTRQMLALVTFLITTPSAVPSGD
jgi:hypothetical protein